MNSLTADPSNLMSMIAELGGLDELRAMMPDRRARLYTKLNAALTYQRSKQKSAVCSALARQLQVGESTIRAWAAAYKSGGWQALDDARMVAGATRADLPAATKTWIRAMIINSKRKSDAIAEVHRLVLDQWQMWRRTGDIERYGIPGFTYPPPDCGKGYPAGFSYESIRRCQPGKHARTAGFEGSIAAYRDLPSILQTRRGTRYLQYVFFDDQKLDVTIRVPRYERSVVPMGFNSLEYLTAYAFEPHIRLRWYDESEQRHKELTQREFVWYVLTRLVTEGFRADEFGTTLIQEHGTAKVWSTLKTQSLSTVDGHHSCEDAIRSLTNGFVRFDDSGIFAKPQFAEMLYGPQPSGNPRFKAPIESFFHLVRTYHSQLIGATGRDPRGGEAPEENYGIELYERGLFRATKDLPAAIREAIMSNYMTAQEFGQIAYVAHEALNARTEHNLTDWDALGHYTAVWRWEEDPVGLWRSRAELAKLPPHLREHAAAQQAANPTATTRLMPWSPRDAKLAYQDDPAIRRLTWQDAAMCLPMQWAKPVKVGQRHCITLTDDLLIGEQLQYLPELRTPAGRCEYLQPGDEILVHLNPLRPDEILCYDQRMSFIGTLTRNIAPGNDTEKLQALFAARARIRGSLEAPARAAVQPEAERRKQIREWNADLIAQAKADAKSETPAPAPKARHRKADPFASFVEADGKSAPDQRDPFA